MNEGGTGMGTLSELVRFLEKSEKAVDSIIEKLNEVQSVYNRNFNNVRTVRTSEIDFLQDEFFKNPARFPEAIPALYSRCRKMRRRSSTKALKN